MENYEEKPAIIPKDSSLFDDEEHFIGWREFNKMGSIEWQDEMISVDSLEEEPPYNSIF